MLNCIMSAFGSLADILRCGSYVRFNPKSGHMCGATGDVRFVPIADIVEMSALCRTRCEMEYETHWRANTFSTGGPLLHIEFAQASVGVHNEYFLHHRRRGRCTSRCRLLGSALNNKILFDLFLVNAYVRDFYPRLRRWSCFACCHF